MVNFRSRQTGDFLLLLNGVVLAILLNVLSSEFFLRFDLTEEKRYSIKPQTKEVLKNLDGNVYVEVYLEGDLNAALRMFRKSIEETLEEFRIYSDNKVQFQFIDPASARGTRAQEEFMAELAGKGIQPKNVIATENGQRVEKIIFPGAIISYGQAEEGVMLLKGIDASSINRSIEGVEFELVNAIHKLTNEDRKRVGILTGHGELGGVTSAGFQQALSEVYQTEITTTRDDLRSLDAIVVAKPTRAFSLEDKYAIDQYVMKGGSVFFLIDKLEVSMDSVALENYFAFPYNLDLDDLLFRYGVRLNNDLVQDRNSGVYPIVTGTSGSRPQIQLLPWPYFPLINQYADHPVTRNLDAVVSRFASTMDTVKADGVRKTPLLFTSPYSRSMKAPVRVFVNDLRKPIDPALFNESRLAVGYLLEGNFTSLFKNRFVPPGFDQKEFLSEGKGGKVVVLSDGDLLRNEVNPRSGKALALGVDPFTNYTFANDDLLMNVMAYLTDEQGLIRIRNKEVKIRPLDKQKVETERFRWQVINLLLPLAVLVAFGVIKSYLRKRRFTVD